MNVLVVLLISVSVTLIVFAIGSIPAVPAAGLQRRLAWLRAGTGSAARRSGTRTGAVEEVLEAIGGRVPEGLAGLGGVRRTLQAAGFRGRSAPFVYLGARATLFVGVGTATAALAPLAGAGPLATVGWAALAALIGWLLPGLVVRRGARRRQREIQSALPDMLDLLVVCVEAGQGLNQALLRVSQEIASVSPAMSAELDLVNREIRAGASRQDAMRNLGERTDLFDLRSLAAMLIQADRFGTSIGNALRVHAESLRTARRQRAEEAAAKTTIQLVFPLVFCVFPAMFVVVVLPAVLHVLEVLRTAR